ncbi:MAG: ABC transporter substrate-binding protein [Acidimicrobiales bacterium]
MPSGVDLGAGVVTLATFLPLSFDPSVRSSRAFEAGIRMALDDANAAGGVDGCTFDLVVADGGFDPEDSLAAAPLLTEEVGPYAVLEQFTASTYAPDVWRVFSAAGVISWDHSSGTLPQTADVYLVDPLQSEQIRVCVDHLAASDARRLAVVGPASNPVYTSPFAPAGLQSAVSGIETTEVPLHPFSVSPLDDPTVSAASVADAVEAILGSDPDAVVINVMYPTLLEVVAALRNAGFTGPVCTTRAGAVANANSDAFVGEPADATDGLLAATDMALPDLDDPGVDAWRERASAYTGPGAEEASSQFSLNAYYSTLAFLDVFDRLDGDLSHASFEAAAESTGEDPLDYGAIGRVQCGEGPAGHACGRGAAIVRYDAATNLWSHVEGFVLPADN